MKTIVGVTAPGDHCEWCGAPAVDRVEVQPARTRKLRNGQEEILDLAIVATVGAQHATIAAGGGSEPHHDHATARSRRRAARPARPDWTGGRNPRDRRMRRAA
jgi:hypothetical protein